MSRTESLQFLSSVIDELEPIGQMTPGQPLRAVDWNAMARAVADLARLVASRERTTDALLDERYATIDHSHTGQITLAWFDPKARALLEEAMSGAVEQRAALQSLRNEVVGLKQEMATLRTQIEAIRVQVDGLRDEDSSRQRDISKLSLRVESLADVEENVATLNDRFSSIGSDLEKALAFRQELVDEAGNPIDVAGLNSRVSGLETIRNNLRLADGSLVNIREIESALARLEEDSINRNDVDDVILQRLRAGNILDEAGLIDSVAGQVEAGFAERFDLLTATTDQLTTRVTGLDDGFASQAGRLTTVESGLQSAMTSLGALSGLPAQVSAHATRLAQAETRILANESQIADLPAIRQRLSTVEGRVSLIDNLSLSLSSLTDRVQVVESNMGQIDVLSGTLDAVSTRVGAIEEDLSGLAVLQAQVTANTNTLQTLGQRVTVNEAELKNLAGVSEQLSSLTKTTEDIIGWRTTVDKRLDELSREGIISTNLVARVDTLEATVADTSTTVRRIDQSLTSIESVMPSLRTLPDQFKSLDTRVTRVERGGIIR
jgi:chromosome segregation ATPase